MNEDVKSAGERLRESIKFKGVGRPPIRYFAEVSAVDVVIVGASIPDGKHTAVTTALMNGAAGALGGRDDPELKVHQYADQVAKLLEAAGV